MNDLVSNRALVCGSSQGIGRACALELARRGAAVTVMARDEAALASVVNSLDCEFGQKHGLICADSRNADQVKASISENIASSGPFQILVNNTGGPKSGPILDAETDAFSNAFSQHVVCNQELTRTVVPGMKECGFGRIVNIISTSVMQPIRGLGVSNTIRAAVANWAKTVAVEVAPFGITVNNVLPGYTDTIRLKSLISAKAQREDISEDEVVRSWVASIPVGRLASADEIAAVVGFLASPAASYVSGVNIPVDGGRLASQ